MSTVVKVIIILCEINCQGIIRIDKDSVGGKKMVEKDKKG